MPELSRFYGIVIQMYYADHGRPHFHAIIGDDTAVFDIETGEIRDGYIRATGRRLVLEWLELHRDELFDRWNRRSSGPLPRIAPLE